MVHTIKASWLNLPQIPILRLLVSAKQRVVIIPGDQPEEEEEEKEQQQQQQKIAYFTVR